VKTLIERGVNRSSARALVAKTEEAKIHEKIALFDWLSARKDQRIQKSPAGFLYRSIAEDFSLPEDYVAATAPAKPRVPVRNVVPLQRHTASTLSKPEAPSDRAAIDELWNSLGAEEQQIIEQELVAKALPFLREQYLDGQSERGLLFQTVRQAMIDGYIRRILSGRPKVA
jgi:hypothetical protein